MIERNARFEVLLDETGRAQPGFDEDRTELETLAAAPARARAEVYFPNLRGWCSGA